jgi:hypothetical protein
MRIKFFILTFIFSLINTYSFSKPMCQQLYERIYNEASFRDVTIPTFENEKTIGIRLLKKWNEKKIHKWSDGTTYINPDFDLVKNPDGYYIVGKITDEDLVLYPHKEKIEVGDIILSINDIDLREFDDEKDLKILRRNVSNLFEENELIKFEILKKDKNSNKLKKVIVDRTGIYSKKPNIRNKIMDYDAPYVDLFINSIAVNEKNGTFTANIEKNFMENVDDRHSITKIIWEELIKDHKYKDNKLNNFRWYQCPYDEEEWGALDNIDLTYGVRFDNLIKEDNSLKKSYYNIKPNYSLDIAAMKKVKYDYDIYFNDGAYIEYFSTGIYTFLNNFNLKTFPFDKQKLKILLYNDKFELEDRRSLISSFSFIRANEFIETNKIPGWNIDKVSLKYDFYKDDTKDDFLLSGLHDGVSYELDISRKSGYYVFKIIFPIILILMICWSAVWIDPKEIESRLTITIVCLLSLIAYNFVIDSDLPKLEYLTIMDYIILISYIYAAIPNFLSIYSFQLIKKNKALAEKHEAFEKKYGLPSYILIIFIIVIVSTSSAPEHTNSMFSWAAMGN